jgi:MSHA biogenesis protein MshN
MSVINQMLNQLEQRGAHHVAEQAMVRAVPQARRNNSLQWLAFGLAVLGGIAVWQWVQARKPVLSSVEGPVATAASIAPKVTQGLPHPEGAGSNTGADELEKLTLQHQASQPDAPVSGVAVAYMPASRLSFELSSVPLPSTIRHEPKQSSNDGNGAAEIPRAAAKPARKPVKKPARKPVKKPTKKTAKKTAKTVPTKTAVAEVAAPAPDGALPMKQISPEQLSDAEFRKASALLQQGRIADAISGYEAALRLDADNDAARQALVALLLESKRGKDAERVLQERLKSRPDHTRFTMMLARLQVERGAVAEATSTLEKALPYANSQAGYQAFLAALLQRQNRNDEAIAHYQVALKLAPNNGIWLMGYGISLQALKRNAAAKTAFQHALDTRTLSPDLQAFVRQKLKEL